MIWPVTFFTVALVAGLFGYGGIAADSAGIAQLLCLFFAGLGAVSVLLQIALGDSGQRERSEDRNLRF
ncbi:Uncharacterized membrane protein YtjA, UPF0391 family [Pseudooceanicola antarcticus]|uniref:DUF1328 domain-containing protein n=1 Tax=Pseudooceanicola antarcticus TaxID=1247613 RepID=A0A285INH4_9RHOB|nr:DUF1328 domain-containing protein [Pseudooceanicola antarcticus]PJE28654.1 DUF1328 domain-containing protein [Pseudooceanicola antarcticus]SNY48636.1 Uncharacterized membrane protein YtjA, UPF0391 family [Pseudooceanicola antarcticus]